MGARGGRVLVFGAAGWIFTALHFGVTASSWRFIKVSGLVWSLQRLVDDKRVMRLGGSEYDGTNAT